MNAKDVRAVARARWERRKGKWTPANVVMVTLATILLVVGVALAIAGLPRDGERATYELESGVVIEATEHARPTIDGSPLKKVEADHHHALAVAGLLCIGVFGLVVLVWLTTDMEKRREFADALVEYWASHQELLPPQDWKPSDEEEAAE